MRKFNLLASIVLLLPVAVAAADNPKDKTKTKPPEVTPLDQYVIDAVNRPSTKNGSGGWVSAVVWFRASLTDMALDPRADRHSIDLVTILVSINTSASSTGNTKTSRQSSLTASAGSSLASAQVNKKASNLLTLGGNNSLQGQGGRIPKPMNDPLTTNLNSSRCSAERLSGDRRA